MLLCKEGCRLRLYRCSNRSLVREFGDEATLPNPKEFATTVNEIIAVVDLERREVVSFNKDGELLINFGNELFALPVSIAVDRFSRFFVLDQVKQRVTLHAQDGSFVRDFSVSVCDAPHLIRCSQQLVLVGDVTNNTISVFVSNDQELCFVCKLVANGDSTIGPETSPSNVESRNTSQDIVNNDVSFASNLNSLVETASFLDLSTFCALANGLILISDHHMQRLHVFSTKTGRLGHLQTRGYCVLRPQSMSVNQDGYLAIVSRGPERFDDTENAGHDVLLFKLFFD